MPNINIYNKRHYAKRDHPDSKTFYCGRRVRDTPGSPLCNPARISKVVNRNLSLRRYRDHFDDVLYGHEMEFVVNEKMFTRSEFMQALADICLAYESGQDVDLLCWCAPQACHCEIIRDYVIEVTSLWI